MRKFLFIHFFLVGEGFSAQSSSVQCLKPRPPTTCNLEYVSPKSVLLQPKLLNSNLDGKQEIERFIFNKIYEHPNNFDFGRFSRFALYNRLLL